ncbi:MAG: efflux RND transporter periplasmic adaptor subunit [Burkholderiales bacterium]|nr:efflux RND transporter periplasmic adaptor subunit [Burkholderiales bacterium]
MNRPIPFRRRHWWLAAGATLVVAAAALYAWSGRAVPVALAKASSGSVVAHVSGPGTVQARVPVTLSARITSTVLDVAADVGDLVQRGQVLVLLDSRDLAARQAAAQRQQESLERQVDAAAASVAKARSDLELARARERRDMDLHAQGFLARASLDISVMGARAAEAGVQNAEATWGARRADRSAMAQELVVARTQVGYTRLTAPMQGQVVQRLVEPGTTVGPGTPILRLVDPRSLWVATRVDEAVIERIAVGQPATIRLRSGSVVAGTVARISMQSDAATRELEVHVGFAAPPQRVAIDQEAEVRIEVGREQGVVVPVTSVMHDAKGGTVAMQVAGGRTRAVPVTLGPESGGMVLVRTGVAEGDTVLANAAAAKPGVRVRPSD